MTKIQIYIDFEAISNPFSRMLKIDNDTPYAYSFGIHVGKKFKTRTTIINFNKLSADNVHEFIRLDISKKMRDLIGSSDFKVNASTVSFIGWAPLLEKKILSKSFKGIDVMDQTKGESISLSSLTSNEFKGKNYFKSLKDEISKKMKPEFIQRRGLNQDGALAALAGYLLYRYSLNLKGKWDINIDIKTLISEIKEYSKDDIARMSFLFKNSALFIKRKQEVIIKNAAKQTLSRKINKLNNFTRSLSGYKPSETVESILKKTDQTLIKLKKEKDNL